MNCREKLHSYLQLVLKSGDEDLREIHRSVADFAPTLAYTDIIHTSGSFRNVSPTFPISPLERISVPSQCRLQLDQLDERATAQQQQLSPTLRKSGDFYS